MAELTEEQKVKAKEVMDKLLDYMWNKVQSRMIILGEPVEIAVAEVMKLMLKDT